MSTNVAEKMRAETERFLEKALGLIRNHRRAYRRLVDRPRQLSWNPRRNAA